MSRHSEALTRQQVADLGAEVYQTVYAHTDTVRENDLGADVFYLLGAILSEDQSQVVDWSDGGANTATLAFFQAHFPPGHPVWAYIITD